MQVSQLVCLGLNHRTATVELREHFSRLRLLEADKAHADNTLLQELVVLSTCNRVEFYAYIDPQCADPYTVLIELLARQMTPASFVDHLYFYRGQAVVEHVCRVAAGLDSLVLGEPQILGQINSACQLAQQHKTIGPVLSLLFRIGVQAGKRARTETHISRNPASVSSVALTLAQKVTGQLRNQRILLIGLGEIGNLTLKLLKARGVTQLSLANRTQKKAALIAAEWGGQAYSLEELPQALLTADIVISATRAVQPLLDAPTVQAVMDQRQRRPLVLVDLAVPRDIDPAVGAIEGVCLFDVDDLQNGLDEAFLARQREIPGVEAIIAEEVAVWAHKFEELTVEPLVATLRQRAEMIRQRELARALHNLGEVDAQVLDQLQHFSRALVNQLLHEPTTQLKKKAGQPAASEYACAIRDLFGLAES